MIRNLWPLLIGFAIWAVAFLVLYAVQALGCVWAWPQLPHRALLVAIVVVTLLALAMLLVWQLALRKTDTSAIPTAGAALTLAAIVATLVSFSPTLFVAICI